MWKVTVETGSVSSVLLKIAQRTQPKKMAAFMRRFVDYVVLCLPYPGPTSAGTQDDQLNSVRTDTMDIQVAVTDREHSTGQE